VAALIVPLAGCHIALHKALSTELAKPGSLELDEAETLVFGRFRYVENGKPREAFGFLRPQWRVRNFLEGTTSSAMTTDSDGFFYYVFPRGEYALATMEFGPKNTIFLPMQFPVLRGGQAFYVGTIEVDVEGKYHPLEFVYVVNRLNHAEVLDEYDDARTALLKRYPDFPADRVQKGLLTPVRGQIPRAIGGSRPR
jgi:hypothetical protein